MKFVLAYVDEVGKGRHTLMKAMVYSMPSYSVTGITSSAYDSR